MLVGIVLATLLCYRGSHIIHTFDWIMNLFLSGASPGLAARTASGVIDKVRVT
jgi:hypothetical protein